MTECFICRSEIPDTDKLCLRCARYCGPVLLSDPALTEIRGKLADALEWLSNMGQSWPMGSIADARYLIDVREIQVHEENQKKVVSVLVGAGPVPDPRGAEVLFPVTKAVGISPGKAWAYIEDLQARGVVRIEACDAGLPISGQKPFLDKRLWRWVECEPRKDDRGHAENPPGSAHA
jgi:hypothetical protein